MARDTKTLRIFVGSPGDVTDARNQAFEIIEHLDKDPMLPDGYAVEAVGWDRITYASPTWLCPQKAIDKGLPRPSACDIALFILWRRIGTPLREADYPQETHPPGLERPPTGTEWEFFDAMAAAEESGAPLVLTFRCTREQTIATEDNEEKEQLIWQRRQVRDFFKRFRDNKGGHRWSLIEYGSLEELADKLDAQLRATVQALTQSGDSHPIDPLTTPTGRPLQRPPRHPHFTGRA